MRIGIIGREVGFQVRGGVQDAGDFQGLIAVTKVAEVMVSAFGF
jgi:hypothetical protein